MAESFDLVIFESKDARIAVTFFGLDSPQFVAHGESALTARWTKSLTEAIDWCLERSYLPETQIALTAMRLHA